MGSFPEKGKREERTDKKRAPAGRAADVPETDLRGYSVIAGYIWIQDAIARHLSRLYSEREKAEICLELLDSYLEKDCKVKKRTAGRLADHIVDLFAHGALEWKTVQEIIN